MGVSQNLCRLHSIRESEERQHRAEMELALAELGHLQGMRNAALKRARNARALAASSVRSGEQIDRIAALQELTTAERSMKALAANIAAAETDVLSTRRAFLSKRMERRQVESLLETERARAASETRRKSQFALDDWYLSRRIRTSNSAVPITPEI